MLPGEGLADASDLLACVRGFEFCVILRQNILNYYVIGSGPSLIFARPKLHRITVPKGDLSTKAAPRFFCQSCDYMAMRKVIQPLCFRCSDLRPGPKQVCRPHGAAHGVEHDWLDLTELRHFF